MESCVKMFLVAAVVAMSCAAGFPTSVPATPTTGSLATTPDISDVQKRETQYPPQEASSHTHVTHESLHAVTAPLADFTNSANQTELAPVQKRDAVTATSTTLAVVHHSLSKRSELEDIITATVQTSTAKDPHHLGSTLTATSVHDMERRHANTEKPAWNTTVTSDSSSRHHGRRHVVSTTPAPTSQRESTAASHPIYRRSAVTTTPVSTTEDYATGTRDVFKRDAEDFTYTSTPESTSSAMDLVKRQAEQLSARSTTSSSGYSDSSSSTTV